MLAIFTDRKKKRAKGHLKNLLQLAASDGIVDLIEAEYLMSLAGRFNISEAELKRIQDNPHLVTYQAPTNDIERFEQLHQLVRMMMIDGEVHEKEMNICKAYSEKLGLRTEFVEDFVTAIGESVDREQPSDVIIRKLLIIAQERASASSQEQVV